MDIAPTVQQHDLHHRMQYHSVQGRLANDPRPHPAATPESPGCHRHAALQLRRRHLQKMVRTPQYFWSTLLPTYNANQIIYTRIRADLGSPVEHSIHVPPLGYFLSQHSAFWMPCALNFNYWPVNLISHSLPTPIQLCSLKAPAPKKERCHVPPMPIWLPGKLQSTWQKMQSRVFGGTFVV